MEVQPQLVTIILVTATAPSHPASLSHLKKRLLPMQPSTFLVTRTFDISKAQCYRPDLDMGKQLKHVKHHHAVEMYEHLQRCYDGTVASAEHHQCFVLGLLGECRRYLKVTGRKSTTELSAAIRGMAMRIEGKDGKIQSQPRAFDDTYLEDLQEIASWKVFSGKFDFGER
jgi:hypothetical protein